MKASEMRAKSVSELKGELVKTRRAQFDLRMQAGSGQTVNPSAFGELRRTVARIKTVMNEKAREK